MGKSVRQRRTPNGTDSGQGKAWQVCLALDLLRRRLDIVQCLPGADHLSTGEREILFICPAEQHNKRRCGKRKVANRSCGEADDAARCKNVCFKSILQFYLLGGIGLPYKPQHKNYKDLRRRRYYECNPQQHFEKQTPGEKVPFVVRR